MKIEVAQIGTDPGCIEENTEKIINILDTARREKVDLVVFPELTIPGYMSMDLMLYPEYVRQNLLALDKIVKNSKDIGAIVGFIRQEKDANGSDGTPLRYNSAALIQNGKVLGVEDKTLLPNYDVFYENRYFTTARKRQIHNFNGIKLGIEICEDLWDENYPVKVTDDLVRLGADLLIDISCSPFYVGKLSDRQAVIKRAVVRNNLPLIYANTVGCQDGYDGELVFDGQSMVFDGTGKLVKLGKAFQEDTLTFDFPLQETEISAPIFNPIKELHQALVLGIKDYFRRSGFTKAFIGLSGGIDSALVAALAAESLGRENITGISMPSHFSSKGSRGDAKDLARSLGINFRTIPIETVFREMKGALRKDFADLPENVTEENIQARIRGMILMAEANKFGGLVLSTGNKTETALGYTTLYGDMCGGLAAISDVSKLKVYELARFINSQAGKEIIPKGSIEKAPSAELNDNQTDEKGLGAPYEILSPLVDEIIEERKTAHDLIPKYSTGIVSRVLDLVRKNEHKRRQAPPAIKVTKKAFGIGRRIPMTHKFQN